MRKINPIIYVFALAVMTLFMQGCTGSTQIPPASVGIKFNGASGISEQVLKPEVVYTGLNERVIVYPTSIHNASYVMNPKEGDKQGDDSIVASTVEGGSLPMDLTVAYHVDPANVTKMFESFGTEDLEYIQNNFIRYYATYALNCVTGSKSIFDVTSKDRANVGMEVKSKLSPMLGEYGISVDDVYIGEVHPGEDLQSKVNERLNKYNELQVAKNAYTQAGIEAKTILTNARKQAELNDLLSKQGDSMIALQELTNKQLAISKWDGLSPTVGGGFVPFTNIKLR
jgi:regulator of protease activity HflC (stomatin/prohibitin superfamily)